MRILSRIVDIMIWVDAWLACDLFLIWLMNPGSSRHPVLISVAIGMTSYYFAEWISDTVQWLSYKLNEKLFGKRD